MLEMGSLDLYKTITAEKVTFAKVDLYNLEMIVKVTFNSPSPI